MLQIQKYIQDNGLEAAINEFKLDTKEYPHKILLKYSQIESPMGRREAQECRGLILEKGTWNVISLSFTKFFNLGEGHAAPVDWSTARVYKKLDGTLINLYYDVVLDKFCTGTTGTAEGEGNVNNFHYVAGIGDITFSNLFVHSLITTYNRFAFASEGLNVFNWFDLFKNCKGYTLAFELCTPYNVIVTPHEECSVHLLGVRKLDTMEELSYDELEKLSRNLMIPLAPSYQLKNADDIVKTFEGMSFKEEGYVVCDENFNRIKIKNPAYVAVHHMAEATAFWRILDIVRTGEVDEYLSYFPTRKDEVDEIVSKWDNLIKMMQECEEELVPQYESYWNYHEPYRDMLKDLPENIRTEMSVRRKPLAIITVDTCNRYGLRKFSSYYFSLLGDKTKTIRRFLMEYDGKDLFEYLKKLK